MTAHDACFVCRKHRGAEAAPSGPIFEDALVYASHRGVPPEGRVYLGWCFVEPRRHIAGLDDLTDQEAAAMGRLVTRLSGALKAELNAEHVYAFVLGDRVPHVHIHVIVRHPGAPEDTWGVRVDKWPDAPTGDEADIRALVTRLREGIVAHDQGIQTGSMKEKP